jgi:hypothetical protein
VHVPDRTGVVRVAALEGSPFMSNLVSGLFAIVFLAGVIVYLLTLPEGEDE